MVLISTRIGLKSLIVRLILRIVWSHLVLKYSANFSCLFFAALYCIYCFFPPAYLSSIGLNSSLTVLAPNFFSRFSNPLYMRILLMETPALLAFCIYLSSVSLAYPAGGKLFSTSLEKLTSNSLANLLSHTFRNVNVPLHCLNLDKFAFTEGLL